MLLEQLINPQLEKFNLIKHIERMDPTFIPIHFTGGIGDVITAVDAIKFLQEKFQIVVYTAHLEAFKYFYKEPLSIAKQMPSYCWHLNFDSFIKFVFSNKFHGFLIKEHEELFLQQQQAFQEIPQLDALINQNERKYFLTSIFAKQHNKDKRTFPLFSLGYK